MRTLSLICAAAFVVCPAFGGGDVEKLEKKVKELQQENQRLEDAVKRLETRVAELEKKLNQGIRDYRADEVRDRRYEDQHRREYELDRAKDTFLFLFTDDSALPVLEYELKEEKVGGGFGLFSVTKKYYYVKLESGEIAKAEYEKVKEIRRVAGRR